MNNMFDITGKVAVVTGGSGVLGSNIAEGLLKAGAKVIIIGAHQDRVDAALERARMWQVLYVMCLISRAFVL